MSGYIKKYGVPGVCWIKIEFPTRLKDRCHNQTFSEKIGDGKSHFLSVLHTNRDWPSVQVYLCVYVFSALALTYQG